MGKIVYTPFDGISVTNSADQDIFLLTAPSTHKLELHAFELTSPKTAAEAVKLVLMRRSTAGTGGVGSTEVLREEDDAAITGTCTQLVTTPGTDGAVIQGWQWEQLGPLTMLYTPEMRIVVQPSGFLALHLSTVLGATTLWSGYVAWEEF